MVIDHLDAVWRAALAASGDQAVAEDVTAAVLTEADRDAPADALVRGAVLAAVRRAPAPAFAAMAPTEREAVALARIAGCRADEIAAALGIGDGAARRLLTEGLRSTLRRHRGSAPRTLPPALGCGSAAS
jgi:DNA-directed RNA polymerase specialized sigma24 family protein